MRLTISVPWVLALALFGVAPALAAPKEKGAGEGGKRSGKEISTDDKALDKQMDWESKVLGPNTVKKIDLAKIQKLQAEEMARREKQEKIDQAEKDRKEREAAAAAAAQRNVKGPSTRDVPSIEETPPPAKPVEKHDDAFVDKVLTGKAEKKKASVTNDEVDQLLNKAKQEKGASIVPAKGKGKGADTVDQLLATADKQAAIKTTTKKQSETTEAVSAEAAAREATLKAIAAAAAKAQEEKNRNKRPAIPDAAMLRAQAAAPKAPPPSSRTESSKSTSANAGWTDPFASDSSAGTSKGRNKVAAPPPPTRTPAAASGRHAPSTRPAANEGWQDPFDTGSGSKPRPAPAKTAPAARPGKRPPNWKDPFAWGMRDVDRTDTLSS